MRKKSDEEVIREVEACIDAAIEKNRHTERIVVGVLLMLFVAGLGLMIYAAISQRWEMLVPGSIVQIILFFPIRKLIQAARRQHASPDSAAAYAAGRFR